ncbi:alpha/beta hydrolase-fold protein [Chitinophagaceae bacterium LB-8]|uniref:Alpha/beta hydrolase-fold protein n=1 Tax=Paraflavisolibacter caeni TaxID=2982496 RepID=A0A9X3BFG3_9BACT|nr:alpha/beta hydrolase-fold protein [Paraflavisolibacter caeni]MCU7548784.1 alpha/beta hydrolase-fold protein [Paraflavisolibacter caeni]
MKKIFCSLLLVSFCIGKSTLAQEVYQFTKALTITSVHHYGREAIYTDQLAYQYFANTLKAPVAGQTFGTNDSGQTVIWKALEADSLNRFRTREFGGGGTYLYLTYSSDRDRSALLHVKGNSALFFNGEQHTGDPYSSGWLYIPVQVKKGLNEIYLRSFGMVQARLLFPEKPVILNVEDPTMPSIVLNENNKTLQGAVVVINTTAQALKNLNIKSRINGSELNTALPVVPALSIRKVSFALNADGVDQKGQFECSLVLLQNAKPIDEKKVTLEAVGPTEKYSQTFISYIDGSLQYYAVAPQNSSSDNSSHALFLSVHGAGVEAIGQAKAYQSKDWGTLVAATNRRPRGFNWEDWGRLDALEVLQLAKDRFNPDPKRIYLTGHSMGGHGTWFLGATYPDKWAAIAPCAGYPTLKEYGSADGKIPDSSRSQMEQMLLRASNQSDVVKLVSNYKPLGIYILHGDSDKVVSVNYARQMKKQLADFHADLSYYEYPGGEHWYGNESVDWKPLFDFFKWHQKLPDSSLNTIDFITSNPGISPSNRWASVQQQIHPLQYSRIKLNRNKNKRTITGTTENVQLLKLDLSNFGIHTTVTIDLDSLNKISYTTSSDQDSLYLLKQNNQWGITNQPGFEQKGPHRYGTFKEAFNYKMVFVYGTIGSKDENEWSFNKARYDAETWYYRGNGAVDVISDKDYSQSLYKGRNVIIYGNANSNSAYKLLLQSCPIQLERNTVKAGNHIWKGDDLAAYFIWPMKGTNNNSIGVIGGTGLKGMNAATGNQYFAGGSGFPDFMVFSLGMLRTGGNEVKLAGFFDNAWKLSESEMIQNK